MGTAGDSGCTSQPQQAGLTTSTAMPLLPPLWNPVYPPLPLIILGGQCSWRAQLHGPPLRVGMPHPTGDFPAPGGWVCWSSPVLEAHQVLDQLLHVGIAVYLAELTVEEPVCMALHPACWNSEGGLKRNGLKPHKNRH